MIKDSGERTQFYDASGKEIGVRDMHAGKGRMDLLPLTAVMEVSKLCEAGALKYGEHNVDKGIPLHSLIDSGIRHAFKFWSGWEDEDHLTAACWNFLWALEFLKTKPELDDRPRRDGSAAAPSDPEPELAKPAAKSSKPKQVLKKPKQVSQKPKAAAQPFTGYGAVQKRRIFERLLAERKSGTVVSLAALAGKADGLTEEDIVTALGAGKMPIAKWELIGKALDAIEKEAQA